MKNKLGEQYAQACDEVCAIVDFLWNFNKTKNYTKKEKDKILSMSDALNENIKFLLDSDEISILSKNLLEGRYKATKSQYFRKY